ncbi:M1 family metallopeptidase [Vicingaceae bacterium]|nr:M1 family metallopeptidase [Vicingaceae bacterium]MDC1451758.1 M1 family metallopeptidase [Vicingaceae bacterium]
MKRILTLTLYALGLIVTAQESTNKNPFRQLKQELPTPNSYRTAAGFPGHEYYQQKADYVMNIELDDNKQILSGEETVTYHNMSPDALPYLWVQLDQNVRAKDSDTKKISQSSIDESISFDNLKRMMNDFDGGFKLEFVKRIDGKDLNYTVNKTMMRIDLDEPLKSGESFSFKIKWWYKINDRMQIGGRSGYEYFEDEDNYLYTIAQFFPRMAVYNDVEGWQNKQFLGRGEFTLPFGDYKVSITVPEDHTIASTGVLQNPGKVLTSKQIERLEQAKTADQPVLITTQAEADKIEKKKASGKKTWVYHAENVRDFGFASSRKFIWDAIGVQFGERTVMAMSYYPKEGNPVWEDYSTKAVAHTLRSYSNTTFDYPYPVAISVNSKSIGMEYPMICFNYGRPEKDGTYTARLKYGVISVIIHEVGHNFFPMIVNSDERQWTWMDEGLNTFCQYLSEMEWDVNYPTRRGPAYKIVDYMKGDKSNITPIMTNSESIFQFGNNAYGKPATALNVLRETIMGRELFDHAFKQYAQTWKFKHPTPADFFRIMEDASGTDLDWFWRGWFFSTDHCDIALNDVKWMQISDKNPVNQKAFDKKNADNREDFVSDIRNKVNAKNTVVELDPSTKDFYNSFDKYKLTNLDKSDYKKYIDKLTAEEKKMLAMRNNFYELNFQLIGGLVMPIILEFTFTDGTTQKEYIPAEIWKMGNQTAKKVFWFEKEVKSINLDPNLETADVDRSNNYWPAQVVPSRFELYQRKTRESENEMQKAKRSK